MEHRDDADAGAQVLGVGRDRERGLGRCLHEQVVDHALVLIGDVAELGRQRVDDMEIVDRQQLGLALGEPPARRSALTLRAVPVATTVVGDDGVSARLVLATCNVAAERRRAAALDRRSSPSTGRGSRARGWPHAKRGRGRGKYPRPPDLAEPCRRRVSPLTWICLSFLLAGAASV